MAPKAIERGVVEPGQPLVDGAHLTRLGGHWLDDAAADAGMTHRGLQPSGGAVVGGRKSGALLQKLKRRRRQRIGKDVGVEVDDRPGRRPACGHRHTGRTLTACGPLRPSPTS